MAPLCQRPGRARLQAPKALSGHHYPHSVALITWRFFLLLWPTPQTCTQVPLCLPPLGSWFLLIATFRASPLLPNLCLYPSPCQPRSKPSSPSSCLPLSEFSNLGVDTAKASALSSLGGPRWTWPEARGSTSSQLMTPVRTEHSLSIWPAIHPGFIASGGPILNGLSSSGLYWRSHTEDSRSLGHRSLSCGTVFSWVLGDSKGPETCLQFTV